AAPPGMVVRESGMVILIGVASADSVQLPAELERRVEHVGHVRRLAPLPGEDLPTELARYGLIDLTKVWMKAPAVEAAAQHVARANDLLDRAQPSLEVPGLTLLDPDRPVSYYPERWVQPRTHSGRFVARRDQAYGADLWCYVEV